MESVTGSGMESALTNEWLKNMQAHPTKHAPATSLHHFQGNLMVPKFKAAVLNSNNEYYGEGLLRGLEACDDELRSPTPLCMCGACCE